MRASPSRSDKDRLFLSQAAVPADTRVYAIGDIHGRSDLLSRMADLIAAEVAAAPHLEAVTVCLGDYIDRGPGSAQVIERLARGAFPTRLVTLRGNHEDILLNVLAGTLSLAQFYDNGGDATLRSYGLQPRDLLDADRDAVEAALDAALPAHHVAFVEATRHSIAIGDYFFCHAGARPGLPLARQTPRDLMWIREGFLTSTYDFGKVVIHGHTPVPAPEIRINGIDIDTRAFASGVLTAIVLEGQGLRFLQAEG